MKKYSVEINFGFRLLPRFFYAEVNAASIEDAVKEGLKRFQEGYNGNRIVSMTTTEMA